VFLFTPNDAATRLSVQNIVTTILEPIKTSGSLFSYKVTCDTTNNTPTVVSAGQLLVDITLKQSVLAESIVINFTVETST